MSFQHTIVAFCSATDVLVTGLCMVVMACRVTDKRIEADIENDEVRVRLVRLPPLPLLTS